MTNFETYRSLVAELLAKQSISTDPGFKSGIEATVTWLNDYFAENGFTVERVDGYGNPIVVAKYHVADDKETYFVYGHYDVQPANQEDGWDADPFTLTEKDGKLLGRGIVDNKGQFMIHLVSIINLIKTGKLQKNIVFVVEGDEETGGGGISELFEARPELFKADQYVISDGEMPYKPVVTASFRGTFNMTVKVTTAANNLHSGLYGGAAPSATVVASKLIAAMYDDKNRLAIKGFYDNDLVPTVEEMQLCQDMDAVKTGALDQTGIKKWFTGDNNSFCEVVGFTTMIVPSGISAGYTGNGYSNIVPATATLKLNVRIAANQTVAGVRNLVEQFLKENTPEYATAEIIDYQSDNEPVKVDLGSPAHKKAIELLEEVYGDKVLIDFCGATLPVVIDIKRTFGVDPILISLANDDCNMHGVNENYDIGLIKKGLEFSERFFG
ncbi:M20/M25/M40 family metallo-hydrolase [bacterium]|nr:M20/M25/M40 family metallo-hydrolase [bacterium]